MSSARRKDDAMVGLVRRNAPLRTLPTEVEPLNTKLTGLMTKAEAVAFKQALMVSEGTIEATLRAMVCLYATDEAFRAEVDEKRRSFP